MSTKPTHIAYVVVEAKEGSDRKAKWHEVGAVWPHKNGKGFDLVTLPGVSLSGRIVCTERRDSSGLNAMEEEHDVLQARGKASE
jgi:hypothetical protein